MHLQVVPVIGDVLLNETFKKTTLGKVFSNFCRILINLELLERIPAVER